MAQFDVHRNIGPQKAVIPFVVVVQSRRFDASRRRVVIPMLLQSALQRVDPTFTPSFEIDGTKVVLDPLQIVSIEAGRLGECVGSLRSEGNRIVAAIDMLLSRAWE